MTQNRYYPDQTCKRLKKNNFNNHVRWTVLVFSDYTFSSRRHIHCKKWIIQYFRRIEWGRWLKVKKKIYNSSTSSWIAWILSRILCASANCSFMLILLLNFLRLLSLFLLALNARVQQKVITDRVMNENINENTEIK